MTDTESKPMRTFLRKSRCPKCRSLNTRVHHTRAIKQTRICRDCGHRYIIVGVVI